MIPYVFPKLIRALLIEQRDIIERHLGSLDSMDETDSLCLFEKNLESTECTAILDAISILLYISEARRER